MKKRNISNHGYSLVELMVGIGITSVMTWVFAASMADISSPISGVARENDVGTYRLDLKRNLKNRDMAAAGTPFNCMVNLAPKVAPHLDGIRDNLIVDPADSTGNALKKKVKFDVGNVNLLNPNSRQYGTMFVQTANLSNFRLLTAKRSYRKETPGEVAADALFASSNIVSVIEGDLNVALGKKSITPAAERVLIKPVKVRFALMRKGSVSSILDCGARDLADATSQVEACKALGEDFEYVYDNVAGAGTNTGQCYAPIYEPADAGMTPDGVTAIKPTRYMPLRGFFCELAAQGKGFLFQYCTGVK